MNNVILEMKNICKEYVGNQVLKNVDIQVYEGEIHVLLGENGAGKSTLLKILIGAIEKDSGEIFFEGKKVEIRNPKHAQNLGISMICDEVMLFSNLSIAENIFLGEEPYFKKTKLINTTKMNMETAKILQSFNLNLDPCTLVRNISINNKKIIEIIRIVKMKPKLILMDELTASFNEQEVNMLFNLIDTLKKSGCTIIYVSHRIEELQKIGDQISILRDGHKVTTMQISSLDTDKLIKTIVGENIKDRYPKINLKIGREVLRVANLSYKSHLKNINFTLKQREIVGIFGLRGSGTSTLMKTLFGVNSNYSGDIIYHGKSLTLNSIKVAIKNGIAYISQNMSTEAIFPNINIYENISMVNLKSVAGKLFLSKKKEMEIIKQYIKEIGIQHFQNVDSVSSLSSGNKKKLILARWLFTASELFIFNEPTASIDIASKVDIYNLINDLLRNNSSVIINSSDFQELIGICDRILVMYEGKLVKEFDRSNFNKEDLMLYASGSSK